MSEEPTRETDGIRQRETHRVGRESRGAQGAARRRLARLAVVGLGLSAGACAATPEPAPPVEVSITQMSPEVLDEIAQRVAERLDAPAAHQQRGAAAQPTGQRIVRPGVQVGWIRPDRVVGVGGGSGGARPATDVATRAARARRATKPEPLPEQAPLEPNARIGEAIDSALDWLAREQDASGYWRASAAGDRASAGNPHHDVGVTGLAALCFLAGGNSHQGGEHSESLKRAFKALREAQDSEGCIGTRVSQHFMYNHAVAGLALVEGYDATQSPILREAAQSAVSFAMHAQNPYLGWRYGIRDGDNDTSMTAWMTLLLARAADAGFEVDPGAFKGALSWVEKMTEPEFGRTGYNNRGGHAARTQAMVDAFPAEWSEAPTAAGLTIRLLAGQKPDESDLIAKGAALLTARMPRWDTEVGSIDMYYWFWGTEALSRLRGNHWRAWGRSLVPTLLDNQTKSGEHAGSWPAIGAWGVEGGPVYSTAMACISLRRVEQTLE